MDPSRFLLAIRHPSAETADELRRAFRADYAVVAGANGCSVTFDGGFLYTEPGDAVGRYCFASVEEVVTTFSNAPWLRLAAPDPSIGPVKGFMGFDAWAHRDVLKELFKVWCCAAAGYVVATERAVAYDPIRTFTFPLVHALRRGGFNDGDHFLRDNARYMDRVRDIVARALEHAGVGATFSNIATHHNPIRFHAVAPDAEARLAQREVAFPGFDFEMFHESAFERDIIE